MNRVKSVLAVLMLAATLVVAPSTGFVPEESRTTADAWSSGIHPDFCGVGYFKADASSIRATGRTRLHDGFTWREYERSMPGGFGWGYGWTTQWNACNAILGNGPNYPTSKNFWGDSFSPRKR